MMVDEEKQEQIENTSSLIDCDIENLLVEKCHISMNIFKILLLCICIIIIAIPISKQKISQTNNQINKSDSKNEKIIKPVPELKNKSKPEEKNKPEPEEKNKPEPEEKNKPKPEEKNKPKPEEKNKPEPEEKNKPEPEEKNKPKPEEKNKPKPEEKNKPEPEEKKKPKPEEKNKPKPEEKNKPKPEEKNKPKPEEKNKPKIVVKTDEIYSNYTNETVLVNLYISTHKDFKCDVLKNPAYKILCDDMSQLKNKYHLEVIPTYKDNELYPKKRAYGECAKMYYMYKLYKSGNISSKYVGFFHYRRLFKFKNNIPDLDDIFSKNDVILPKRAKLGNTIYEQFKEYHIVHFLDESIEIIKEKFPDYYPYAHKALSKKICYFSNIFIMRKNDFIKWGDFVYGVLFELDRRYNLTCDDDIKKLMVEEVKKHKTKRPEPDYQSRLEGFVIERLGNIFFDRHFTKIYELHSGGL